ncbi:FCD domain-containing protein [Sphingobium sp. Sx8-8]|uniref:FadR/GntR family transcriptional regulator n=1 Tax=Sphingobium sp. Sx8-8 TaxID=2933617 RepID=UPI001F580655|nr:FCD domain-containing protein [Sphingobium sp. Sx8-8]
MDKSISSTDSAERADAFQLPMRFPKTAELLADDIRNRIIRGELKEGDYLPLEGELKSSLGISRPTLREAFRILETEKLISVVRGSRTGARVHQPTAQAVSRYAGYVLQSQNTTIGDIYDARLAIEPFCAWRLAKRKDKGSADVLEAEANKLTAMVNDGRHTDFLIGLVEFHRLIVQETGNRTLLLITTMLQDVTARHQVDLLRRRPLDQETQRKRAHWGLRSFAKLIDLIRQSDPDGAAAHWQLHIINANRSWVPREDDELLLNVLD